MFIRPMNISHFCGRRGPANFSVFQRYFYLFDKKYRSLILISKVKKITSANPKNAKIEPLKGKLELISQRLCLVPSGSTFQQAVENSRLSVLGCCLSQTNERQLLL